MELKNELKPLTNTATQGKLYNIKLTSAVNMEFLYYHILHYVNKLAI